MHRATIRILQALIAVLFALLLVAQIVLIPAAARQTAAANPEHAGLEVPGIVVAVLFVCCVEVVLVCVWRLLSLVGTGSIFTTDAFVWVDVVIWAIAAAAVLLAGSLVVLMVAGGGGATWLLCLISLIVATGLALTVVVMRGLLRNAANLQQDLSEVV